MLDTRHARPRGRADAVHAAAGNFQKGTLEVVMTDAIVQYIGGAIGRTTTGSYRGRLVARTGNLGQSFVTKGTAIDAGFTAVAAGYSGDGEDLFIPHVQDNPELTGWEIAAVSGTLDRPVRLAQTTWLPIGGGSVMDAVVANSLKMYYPIVTGTGTALRLEVKRSFSDDETAADGYQRMLTLQTQGLGVEPSDEDIWLEVFETNSAAAVGVPESELHALEASIQEKDAAQDAEIGSLRESLGEATGGVTLAQVRQAITTYLSTYQFPTENPNVVSFHEDAGHQQLTLTGRSANGQVVQSTISYGGEGQSGLTATAAVNASMAYLATQISEFAWEPSTRTLSFAEVPIADDSITIDKLAATIRNLIQGAARLNQIRPEARADIRTLEDAQKSSARDRIDAIAEDDVREEAKTSVATLTDAQQKAARDRIDAAKKATHEDNPL